MTPTYLEIEWKHFVVGDEICDLCGKTGFALRSAVEELREELPPKGVEICLTEIFLDKTRMSESNEIRMNGVLLEELLSAETVSPKCPSCGSLTGDACCCRAVEIGPDLYEDVPVWAIKKAAYLVLGMELR